MGMDSFRLRFLAALAAAAALVVQSGAAFAGVGQPSPWQMGLQVPVTEVADFMHWFHDGLLWIISIIVLFVLGLIIYVGYRFNEKRNPVPSKTTHNALLEVAWTIIPVLILVVIAVPSFRLLRLQLVTPPADITIKATGHQWYWSYEYPEDQNGGFSFDSNMDANGQPRLLAVDNEVVLPVGKTVRVQVTAADVIHAFAMPSFGLKIDAIPGRLNETWFKAEKEGIFYGQCSLICGQNHAFMPIAIRIVSEQQYAAWLTEAKQKFASTGKAPLAVASRTEVLSAE
ncbi:MAG: cytochrome c oxidase subunit II [Chelatococcus sp.]|jgi:cytochrome c oxidase subunit 2|nr:cytochrome c oxidase subunit II [Chelatococcus sp. HY11]MBX3537151.1 cytochrome c oxidase subunit II [Chelatococcus sp.]MBX3543889.1 cytochrome c oxidase subunit II [Chelatococcus sp.]CAH1648868.1 putative cytochrome c oxidase subunit 2 [Hyphomicrobiales bacterium]CAH1667949.1 putative cytochrome c oxidase subunit 2 [Hyphomicrobiales bacterium]